MNLTYAPLGGIHHLRTTLNDLDDLSWLASALDSVRPLAIRGLMRSCNALL